MKAICKRCGKEFDAKNSSQWLCYEPHFSNCVICGKQFEVRREYILNHIEPKTCGSSECKNALKIKTNIKRYGKDWAQQTSQFKIKTKQTCLAKYGVENPGASKESILKRKSTMIDRYGVETPLKNEEIKKKALNTYYSNYPDKESKAKIIQKRKNTCRERYGVEIPIQSDIFKEKSRQSCLNKYGVDNIFKSDEFRTRIKATMIEKYGVEYTLQSPELYNKMHNTLENKYGKPHALQNPKIKDKLYNTNRIKYGVSKYPELFINDITKKDVWDTFKKYPNEFIDSNFSNTPTLKDIQILVGVDMTSICNIINNYNLQHKIRYVKSNMEEEVVKYIHNLNYKLNIIRNSKSVISPYELDIYLPDLNIAIECNPTSTHNSSFPSFYKCDPLSKNYHKLKTDLCNEKGIFLFHIFGYEWTHKKDVIKSMLSNLLNCNTDKIYARKCELSILDFKTFKSFMDINHRQGSTNAPIRIGLYNNGSLVSAMGFGKLRNTAGKISDNHENIYELVRFCSKLNTTVIGGASKLFKYFIKIYNPSIVKSFSDAAHTRGNLYSTLGFIKVRHTAPNYVWVNMKDDTYMNRMKTQKCNLGKLFGEEIDISNYTEKQIMESHNFGQVFDSGTILWEYIV